MQYIKKKSSSKTKKVSSGWYCRGSGLNCFWKSARTEGNSGDPDPHKEFTKIQPNIKKKSQIRANLTKSNQLQTEIYRNRRQHWGHGPISGNLTETVKKVK